MEHMLKTVREVRVIFWRNHPQFKRLIIKTKGNYMRDAKQNEYPANIRQAFVDYVDHLERVGLITSHLAARVTL